MIHRFIGFWVLRRAWRLLTATDQGPLAARLTREAKRILVGALITLVLLFLLFIAAIAFLIAVLA